MGEHFSYLDLMASLQPPDLAAVSRGPCVHPHGLQLPRSNYEDVGFISTYEEGGSSQIPDDVSEEEVAELRPFDENNEWMDPYSPIAPSSYEGGSEKLDDDSDEELDELPHVDENSEKLDDDSDEELDELPDVDENHEWMDPYSPLATYGDQVGSAPTVGISQQDQAELGIDGCVDHAGKFSYMLPFSDGSSSDDDDLNAQNQPASATIPENLNDPSVVVNIADSCGYQKRRRYKKGEILPDARLPVGMGAVEVALRGSSTRKTEFIFQPKVGITFDSPAEAYEFYNLYSWEKGFGISFGRSDKNRGNAYRTMIELQCSNQGNDKRIIHQSRRCGCKAVIRLLRTEDHGWYIHKFVEDHNHELSESYGEKMQWGSHRRIDESAKVMIKHLRDNNVPLGKVHSIMGSMYGSVQDLGHLLSTISCRGPKPILVTQLSCRGVNFPISSGTKCAEHLKPEIWKT